MPERTLRIALVVSVILNLFAIGAAAGAALIWSQTGHEAAAARRRPLFAAGDAMSHAEQARFRAAMQAAQVQARDVRLIARENRRVAAELFVKDTFDAAAVNAALARARDADFALRTRLEAAVVDFAKDLPQPERLALARGLARGGPFRPSPAHSKL
jgi:uncharacterized membrane protein